MVVRRAVLLQLAVLMPFAGGCWSTPQPGRVVEYWPGQPARTTAIPFAAEYTLYRVTTPAGDLEPVHQVKVEEERNLGFIRRFDGTLAAYASGLTLPLDEGHYRWQLSPETPRQRKDRAREEVSDARRAAANLGIAVVALSALLAAKLWLTGSVGSSGN
jgi:hypothetical protein